MLDLTALILTYNERENIGRCLGLLEWVKTIVIVDSFSTDDTLALATATRPDVKILQRGFDTHAAQWNFGLDQIVTPWVLALDADYELSPELIQEIEGITPAEQVDGYEAEFIYRIFGKPLRATVYPPHTVLFRKQRAHYVDEGHTQVLRVKGNILRLSGRIYHDDRKPLNRWIRSQDRYSMIEARHLIAARPEDLSAQDRLRKKIFFAPGVMFVYLVFGRGLILDGWRGWYYVCQRTIAEMLLSLRLVTQREALERRRGNETPLG
ncbi:MAG: hypothetical protein V7609_816 [Verrucomicrobiota bacterium]